MKLFKKLFGGSPKTFSQAGSQDLSAIGRRAIEELYRRHPDVVTTMVRQGMTALDSLESWFRQRTTPIDEHLKTLINMGLLSRNGLTPEGREFLREGVPKGFKPRLNIHVFDSKGVHPELSNQEPSRQHPSEAQLDKFEDCVRSELRKSFSS